MTDIDPMRASRQDRFGGPERPRLVGVSRPAPLPTEVLVRMVAAGVNPCDVKTGRDEAMAAVVGKAPFTPG